jgi:two-component system sensor histidine kinase YesM
MIVLLLSMIYYVRGYLTLTIFRTLVSYIYAILFVVILIASLLIHQSLYRPFQQIISAMNKVSHGDLTVRLPQGRTTEFILVNTQFNNMVKRIDELNQDVEKQASRAHRAEIRHLQAQINPHFYQNTLNLIYNLAALKKYQLIQETTLYLADYFRFIMRSGDQPIELRDELKHITNYMELQKIRYPGKVEYSVQVEDPLLLQPILPLLIQPFVENSMIHGYTTAHNLFRVDVRVFSNTKGYTVIEVEDNGKGMEPEMIKRLNDIMEESNTIPEHHIGIWNVVSRLYSYYGPSAQIKFLSKKETGTIVRIEFLVPLGEGVNGNEYLNSR